MEASKSGKFNKQLLFFFFSCIAVLIDCILFQMLVICNVSPCPANFTSSLVAVSINYRCIVSKIFAQLTSPLGFLLFLSWYMTSIFIFSKAIPGLIRLTNFSPLFCKICILPLSCIINFYFILFLSRIFRNVRSNNDIYSNI